MSENARKIHDFDLEQYLLNELPAQQMKIIELRLSTDTNLKQRLEALKSDNALFQTEFNAEEEIAGIKRKVHLEEVISGAKIKRMFSLPKRYVFAPAAGLALILVLALIPYFNRQFSAPVQQVASIRTKGITSKLFVYVKRDGKIAELHHGDKAHEGELLQLQYSNFEYKYGMIFSIDGNGATTLHLPERQGHAATMDTNAKVSVPHSYELDNAPQFERFYFVVSKQPFQTGDVLKHIAANSKSLDTSALRKLSLGLTQTLVELKKE